MSAMTFTQTAALPGGLDVACLNPASLGALQPSEILALRLSSGRERLTVGDVFRLSGSDASHLVFHPLSRLDGIGTGLREGRITVEGDAGDYTGMGMRGGELRVTGNAGLLAGCEMRGGLLHVAGNAGDFAGGCRAGERYGMAGGMLLVGGNSGDRAGDRMRRGALLVAGNAGAYAGSRMIAGTLAVLGTTGPGTGTLLRRGTLLLRQPPTLPATFNDCGEHPFNFLPLLLKSWAQLPGGFGQLCTAPAARAGAPLRRWAGDMAAGGKGEVLVGI